VADNSYLVVYTEVVDVVFVQNLFWLYLDMYWAVTGKNDHKGIVSDLVVPLYVVLMLCDLTVITKTKEMSLSLYGCCDHRLLLLGNIQFCLL